MIKDQNDSLASKLKYVTNQALTLEEKAARMEELLKEKEKSVKVKANIYKKHTFFHCYQQFVKVPLDMDTFDNLVSVFIEIFVVHVSSI